MDLSENLNPSQNEAVTALLGPVLVLAGPGSGKTRVLTRRVAHLITVMGVAPGSIVAVTFTNKAAREMSKRVQELLIHDTKAGDGQPNLGTFHALCARIIRQEADYLPVTRDYVIYDDADQRSLVRDVIKDLRQDPKQTQPGRVLSAISKAKNELIELEDYRSDTYGHEIVRLVYERYQQALLANNALDFDDLLFWVFRLLRDHDDLRSAYRRRFQHLLVDEFQDTNIAQYSLLRLLAGENPDLFVVGDPDQSIYRWRGADYRNVHRFQEDYPKARTILLEQNYRSTQTILDVATAVIDPNPGRQRKLLYTDRGPGTPVVLHESYNENDEADLAVEIISTLTFAGDADPKDCAVMYRTNAQSRALEEAFLRAGLAYRIVGAQRFYGRREIKDLIAYLRLIHNPADGVSLLRTLNTPPRGIGEKTVEILLESSRQRGIDPAEILFDLAREKDSALLNIFNPRARRALVSFAEPWLRWIEMKENNDLVALIDLILEEINYQAYIDDGTEEGEARWENIQELRRVAFEFENVDLASFLQSIALISDQDTLSDELNAPTLLTLHAAKGLEFPIVIIIGLDDGVLPHQRSFDDPEAMAEERRLLYVGVTRAKDRLYLLRSFRRRFAGPSTLSEPSRFLHNIPPKLLDGDLIGAQNWEQISYKKKTTWDLSPKIPLEPQYQPGMRVQHKVFGEGVVLSTRIDHDDEEVSIEFEEIGTKHLDASMAQLEILKG
ncbi:MAG TPA: UvrD-helicase domain-containing protein [Anaerolineales bacterium]|nr:UvrD-helicase domain-containing protein [Anaerolineales bacterium]